MSSLKQQLIRLENQKPSLRKHLRSVLDNITKTSASKKDCILKEIKDFLKKQKGVEFDRKVIHPDAVVVDALKRPKPDDLGNDSAMISTRTWKRIIKRRLSSIETNEIIVEQGFDDYFNANIISIVVEF